MPKQHKHGSPFDRGQSDYYYYRERQPHYWPEGTHKGIKVVEAGMTQREIDEYNAGYDAQDMGRKDWGIDENELLGINEGEECE